MDKLTLFGLTTLAIFLGLVVGKQVAKYVIAPMGIPIGAGDPTSEGRRLAA